MILSILIGILFLSSVSLIFKNSIGRNGSCVLIIFFNLISILLCSFFFLYNITKFETTELLIWSYYASCITFKWGFYVDHLSFIFMLTILVISTIIMIYSISYMYVDCRFSNFISFLGYFVFFMLILILSNNFVFMFLGWEGVGLVSFLLVNFWYSRIDSNKGALKALIFNRVGDVGFILFISLMIVTHGSISIPVFNVLQNSNFLIILLVFLAAAGKSAQLILYAWLPDAMEGPTPVSALLHSATMVTAGIFLLLRLASYIYNSNTLILLFLLIIGLITSISSGFFAIFKYDIKKVIAFSTCSQLGLLVCGIALGLISVTFYHLFIHAFFKALLFLSSGVIIHSLFDEQDIRKYGNVGSILSFFIILNCIGTLNIIGFPYLSGFYSKENLILYPFVMNSAVLQSAIIVSSIITIIYSIRLVLRCIGYEIGTFRMYIITMHNSDKYITTVVFILAFFSIFIGYLFSDSFVGLSNHLFLNSNFFYYSNLNIEFLSYSIFYLILFIILLVVIVYIFIVYCTADISLFQSNFFVKLYHYSIQEFFIPMIIWSIVRIYNIIAYNFVLKCLEKGILEVLGLVQFYNILKSANKQIYYKQLFNIFNLIFQILIYTILLYLFFIYISLDFDIVRLSLFLILLIYLNKKNEK